MTPAILDKLFCTVIFTELLLHCLREEIAWVSREQNLGWSKILKQMCLYFVIGNQDCILTLNGKYYYKINQNYFQNLVCMIIFEHTEIE